MSPAVMAACTSWSASGVVARSSALPWDMTLVMNTSTNSSTCRPALPLLHSGPADLNVHNHAYLALPASRRWGAMSHLDFRLGAEAQADRQHQHSSWMQQMLCQVAGSELFKGAALHALPAPWMGHAADGRVLARSTGVLGQQPQA